MSISPASSNTARVVVAIDFGTSRSGYAYAFSDDGKIHHHIRWDDQPIPYPKAPTEILYDPARNIVSWGYSARVQLARLSPEARKQHPLLRNFKMALHEGHPTSSGPTIRAGNRDFLVHHVIADYLRLIKKTALTEIGKSVRGQLRDEEVLWCLTVPAIWTDYDKGVMREAAHQAGLISDIRSERLILVLEPEAAAIHCQEQKHLQFTPGQSFMILDCGGGTVDITAHEINSKGDLCELVPGTGGAYGSTYVDKNFLDFLGQKIGQDVLADFEENEPIAYLDMLMEWERHKCGFGPSKKGATTCVGFPPALFKLLLTKHPDVLARLDEEQGDDSGLMLSYEAMGQIFAPVLDQIIQRVGQELQRMGQRKCDFLLLVGGFSTSPLLQQKINQHFSTAVRGIVVPPEPGAAIVEGAVSFGLHPEKIRSRRSRLTYGIQVRGKFISGIDPESKKCWSEGDSTPRCSDVFDVFVTAGEALGSEQICKNEYLPCAREQKSMHFNFYATRKTKVRHVDEQDVQKIGELTVEMPDTSGDLNRTVECRMQFGATEIKVEAVDLTSGKRHQTTLRFSSTFSSELLGE